MSEIMGAHLITIPATIGLGNVQEVQSQLYLAAETYQRGLELIGDQQLPVAGEAYLGLARIYYEWNDLETAQQHLQQSTELAQELSIRTQIVSSELFLARLKLAYGHDAEAANILAQTEKFVHQHNLVQQMPEVVAVQVRIELRRGYPEAAFYLAQQHNLPLSLARAHLAQGNHSEAIQKFKQVTEICRNQSCEAEPHGHGLFGLAQALLATNGEKHQAIKLAKQAREVFGKHQRVHAAPLGR